MSQIVNRRDLRFVLFELLDIERLLKNARYASIDRETIEKVLDTAQSVAEELYLPCAACVDAHEPQFIEGKVQMAPEVGAALTAYAEAGFFGAGFDESVGGSQLPHIVSMALNGLFSCANVAVANYAFLTIAAAHLLYAFGTREQKALFLPRMIEGRWFGTMCLSETQAGSSLADIRTRAEPMGADAYRIVGSKMWISGGDHELSENIVHMVLAKIPGGPPGVKGISLFIVPKYRPNADGSRGEWNHVALGGLNHKMGQRGTTNCVLNFGDTGDCIGYLAGEPHQGLKYMFHMMNEARLGVGYASVMSALAGYLYSLDYARTRRQGRAPNQDPLSAPVAIIEHADVKRMLLAQKAAVEGAAALCALCALLVDQRSVEEDVEERRKLSLLLEILTPVAKSWPAEHCLEANKLAIQVLGGYGYTRDYPVERWYRDNRLNPIHEGTFGIQGLDLLGRKVRMQDGEALTLLQARIARTVDVAAAAGWFEVEAAALRSAVDALVQATHTTLACPDRTLALANATIYLDAFGHVVIAWIWLWQGVTARAALERHGAGADRAFYEGKLAACRYFFRYELPHVHARFSQVASIDDTFVRITPEQYVGS